MPKNKYGRTICTKPQDKRQRKSLGKGHTEVQNIDTNLIMIDGGTGETENKSDTLSEEQDEKVNSRNVVLDKSLESDKLMMKKAIDHVSKSLLSEKVTKPRQVIKPVAQSSEDEVNELQRIRNTLMELEMNMTRDIANAKLILQYLNKDTFSTSALSESGLGLYFIRHSFCEFR